MTKMERVHVKIDVVNKLRRQQTPPLTQQELAEKSGLSRGLIAGIEKGGLWPRKHIRIVATALNVAEAVLIENSPTVTALANTQKADTVTVLNPVWVKFWTELFVEEISAQLRSVPRIEDPKAIDHAISRAAKRAPFQERFSAEALAGKKLKENIRSSFQVGVAGSRMYGALAQSDRLTISAPVDFLGIAAILRYLILKWQSNIRLDFEHILGADIIDGILAFEERPAACIVADPQVVRYFTAVTSAQLALSTIPMPHVEIRFVSRDRPRQRRDDSSGLFCINTEDLTSQIWALEERFRKGSLSRPSLQHSEVFQSVAAIRDNPEVRTVLWSPRWSILQKLGIAVPDNVQPDFMELFMLIDPALHPVTREALHGAIRGAWWTLCNHPAELQWVVSEMVKDVAFMECFERSVGVSGMVVAHGSSNGSDLSQPSASYPLEVD